MKLYQLNQYFLNVDQISTIHVNILGAQCKAPYDDKDKKFLTINMSNGEFFRIEMYSDAAQDFMKYMNIKGGNYES